MKNFGPFLSNLRSSAGLSLEELAELANSNKSGLSRIENNNIPQPFKGPTRKLIITLAEILCTSKNETKRYLDLAGIDQSLLSETEQIQVGFAPAIPYGTPEETTSLERAERIYKQLLTQLEAKRTTLKDNHRSPNLSLKIQEYNDTLQEIQKRLDKLYNQQTPGVSLQPSSLSAAVDTNLITSEALSIHTNNVAALYPYVNSSTVSDNNSANDNIAELLQPLVEHPQCAWVITWGLGEEISNIELVYDSAIQYEATLPDNIQQALDDWCKKNQTKCHEKKRDPVGTLVRLEKTEWSHSTYKHFVLLSPSRYLTYVAIHPHLGKTQLRPLREAQLDNALNSLRNGERLELPSNFALHMAVVSQDGYLLLRRRASNTELYPSAWEAGIGEFMHGPKNTSEPEYKSGPYHAQFPHFTENGLPDLFLFLKNAVAEELNYHEAQQENFRLYGFAVEYETLAPKLLVIYNADCTIATLLENAKKAKDRARELSSLELTPHSIAQTCSSSRYPSWGPTSKLVMLLALKQDLIAKGKEDKASEIIELIDCFEPKKEFVNP